MLRTSEHLMHSSSSRNVLSSIQPVLLTHDSKFDMLGCFSSAFLLSFRFAVTHTCWDMNDPAFCWSHPDVHEHLQFYHECASALVARGNENSVAILAGQHIVLLY